MGRLLYAEAARQVADFPRVRVYAPVGEHKDLLAYLVRRLLENGANTSFVNRFMDEQVPVAEIVRDPISELERLESFAHPRLPVPAALYSDRRNSRGIDLGRSARACRRCEPRYRPSARATLTLPSAGPIINGQLLSGKTACRHQSGRPARSGRQHARRDTARKSSWRSMPAPRLSRRGISAAARARGSCLEKAADLLEADRAAISPAVGARSGQDACRTPSPRCARRWISAATTRCGRASNLRPPSASRAPPARSNELSLQGRGVFACISPVEFSAGDFCRPGDRGAGGGQRRGREAGRTHAADCRALHQAAARGRRCRREAAASGAGAGTRCSAKLRSRIRRSPAWR